MRKAPIVFYKKNPKISRGDVSYSHPGNEKKYSNSL